MRRSEIKEEPTVIDRRGGHSRSCAAGAPRLAHSLTIELQNLQNAIYVVAYYATVLIAYYTHRTGSIDLNHA